jgi:hypothetical protein
MLRCVNNLLNTYIYMYLTSTLRLFGLFFEKMFSNIIFLHGTSHYLYVVCLIYLYISSENARSAAGCLRTFICASGMAQASRPLYHFSLIAFPPLLTHPYPQALQRIERLAEDSEASAEFLRDPDCLLFGILRDLSAAASSDPVTSKAGTPADLLR